MKICKLHYGLHLLANREGVISETLETIASKIFNDEKIKIAPLLEILEKAGILTLEGNPLYIRLNPWPELGQRQTASKSDCFHDLASSLTPEVSEPKSTKSEKEKFIYEKRLQKTGLVGFTRPPGFEAFLEAWPNPITDKKATTTALSEWNKLTRAQKLPDISIIILALRKSPPSPRSWPSTWLKKHPWIQARRVAPACPVCNDERLVFGTTPEGKKGAVPCPKCRKT